MIVSKQISTLDKRIEQVRQRIRAAADRASRPAADVTLLAVSKTHPVETIKAAIASGLTQFGENRVQEAEEKIPQVGRRAAQWHLIGHLQSNKARKAAAPFAASHSVDSEDLLQRIDTAAAESGAHPDVLVQVDLAGEETKFGASADAARRVVDAALNARAVRLVGLMLLPPWNEDQEQTRPWFRRLRDTREEWLAQGLPADSLRHLSMGMSHDFEAAIEEGATMVRVGTAIFGKRPRP